MSMGSINSAKSELFCKTLCIERYAQPIGKPGTEAYYLFARTKLTNMPGSDYENLRGNETTG